MNLSWAELRRPRFVGARLRGYSHQKTPKKIKARPLKESAKESLLSNKYSTELILQESLPFSSKYKKYQSQAVLNFKSQLLWEEVDKSGSSKTVLGGDIALRAKAHSHLGASLEARALSINKVRDRYRWDLGFQEIAWGETFGRSPVDVVNPSDFRDPLSDDPAEFRVPIAAANLRFFWQSLNLQFIWTPFPRNNKLPKSSSMFDVISQTAAGIPVASYPSLSTPTLNDSEWGGRARYFFDLGLDLSLYFYRHFNRNVAYELGLDDTGNPIVRPIRSKVKTYALTASYAFEDWVVRLDQAVHAKQPVQTNDLAGGTENLLQSVLGLDRSLGRNWTIGTQLHSDRHKNRKPYWASFKIEASLGRGDLEPSLFYFHGLNNKDRWLQPQLTWNLSGDSSLKIVADHLFASSADAVGDMAAIKDKDRVLIELRHIF